MKSLCSSLVLLIIMLTGLADSAVAQFSLFGSSDLQRAVNEGLKPGGDLAKELGELDDYEISTAADARALIKALKKLPLNEESESFSTAEFQVAALFQDVESRDCPAFELLAKDGTPELVRVFHALTTKGSEDAIDDAIFILKILAIYETELGTECVVEAARSGVRKEEFLWARIFSSFAEEHPYCGQLIKELSDPLPEAFIAITFLDLCNSVAEEDTSLVHPFNSAEGKKRLSEWLKPNAEHPSSYAHSAILAVPYVAKDIQEDLLPLGMEYPDQEVQLAAAFASAKLEQEAGRIRLQEACLKIPTAKAAMEYLEQLKLQRLIPAEAKTADFLARADFSRWLSHPNELARHPDDVTIVDQRLLKWHDSETPKQMFLLSYRSKSTDPLSHDDTGVGLVGSMTWCFFDENMQHYNAEDCFAIHYTWEAMHQELIREPDQVSRITLDKLVKSWTGQAIEPADDWVFYRMDRQLKYPQREIAAVHATSDSQPGIAVFDGPRSTWYSASQFPPEIEVSEVLWMHIGRQMLGFSLNAERAWNPPPVAEFAPEFIVEKFEEILQEAETGSIQRRQELLSGHSSISEHFDAYINAVSKVRNSRTDDTTIVTYERVLAAATSLPDESKEDVYDVFSPVGENLEAYARAVKTPEKIKALIELLEPQWDHTLGRSKLADVAWNAQMVSDARRLLERSVENEDPNLHLRNGVDILAEIWVADGKSPAARQLLISMIKACETERAETENIESQKECEDFARTHISKYRVLFPAEAEAELKAASIAQELLEPAPGE